MNTHEIIKDIFHISFRFVFRPGEDYFLAFFCDLVTFVSLHLTAHHFEEIEFAVER